MNILRKIFSETGKFVEKGKPLSWAYPLWEAADTIFFSTNKQTSKGPHIRDNMDIKRTMFFVVIALIPCYIFGAYNIGYLNSLALGIEKSIVANTIFGLYYVLPILIITFIAGAICEITFAIVRKHEVNEGFLVSCALIPLTMPPDYDKLPKPLDEMRDPRDKFKPIDEVQAAAGIKIASPDLPALPVLPIL